MFSISGFFTSGMDLARALPDAYNYTLVAASYLVAALGSFAFLQFADQIAETADRQRRLAWAAGGAVVMGGSIWAMHFVGMLAFVLPVPIAYDGAITTLSAVPAVLAAGVALRVVARPAVSATRLLIGGTLMGAGIGAMHYTGMAAMRLDALVRYDPALFATSVVVAVVLAIVGLQVKFWIGRAPGQRPSTLNQVGGALMLGLAVSAMHYTAMASTYCFATSAAASAPAADHQVFAVAVAVIAGLVLAMATASVLFARRVGREVALREQAVDRERQTTEQLVQAQKMEAVGQLTGGVAHDFNNVLMLMLAHVEALQEEADPGRRQVRLDRMAEAIRRASDLVRQLLAFSRKQVLKPQPTVLNDLVSSTGRLLRRALGANIEIQMATDAGLWSADVDRAQVESALLNLCINARDAMPGGGRLVIETRNVALDHDYARRQQDVEPGDYVLMSVTDTGTGMSPETVARVFEPFFTTKEVGKGSGLGLSMVYGFIKQSGGHVSIYSEVGQGTTVKLYFRRGEAVSEAPVTRVVLPGGNEHILLVEDEEGVRELVSEQLRSLGYRVIEAGDADSALAQLDAGVEIDLVLTDVVMPGKMNGKDLADEIVRRRPGTQVVFMSGYAESALTHDGRLADGVRLLSKPFRKADLANAIHDALTASGTGLAMPRPSSA